MVIAEISPQKLKARLDLKDQVTVVDLRQPWEYQEGHIPTAINIFIQDIPSRFHEIPQGGDIVFQCWHGVTSIEVANFVINNGGAAHAISSLSGGMAGWISAQGIHSLIT